MKKKISKCVGGVAKGNASPLSLCDQISVLPKLSTNKCI